MGPTLLDRKLESVLLVLLARLAHDSLVFIPSWARLLIGIHTLPLGTTAACHCIQWQATVIAEEEAVAVASSAGAGREAVASTVGAGAGAGAAGASAGAGAAGILSSAERMDGTVAA